MSFTPNSLLTRSLLAPNLLLTNSVLTPYLLLTHFLLIPYFLLTPYFLTGKTLIYLLYVLYTFDLLNVCLIYVSNTYI